MLFIFLGCNSIFLNAQFWDEDPWFSCAGGANIGRRVMGEAMFGLGYYKYDPNFLHIHTGRMVHVGTEYNFGFKKPLWGPKMTVNFNGPLVGGGSLIYFTDGNKGSLYLAPHIGVGAVYWDLRFGYNIPMMKEHLKERVNHFTISLIFIFVE